MCDDSPVPPTQRILNPVIVWCIQDSRHVLKKLLALEEVVFYTPVVEGINTVTELIEMFIECYLSNEVGTICTNHQRSICY